MNLWTSAEIANATGGTASEEFEVSGVAFDSREVGPSDLFVAMQGEVTDGHRFLGQAFAQGAAGAIVSALCDGPHARVADTLDFAFLDGAKQLALRRPAQAESAQGCGEGEARWPVPAGRLSLR